MYLPMILTLASFLFASWYIMRPCNARLFDPLLPGYNCNKTYLLKNIYGCEQRFVNGLIRNPSLKCSLEVYRLQECTGRLIVNTCYNSLYAVYPKFRHAISIVTSVTLQQFNNAVFYCRDHDIDWTSIPRMVKRLLPCDVKFFQLSKKCSDKFYSVFTSNRSHHSLCSLYKEAKVCRSRLSLLYCKATLILNKQNPFCKEGLDKINTSKIALRCMVGVCAKSSSRLIVTPPCLKPKYVTCTAPAGSPFEYDTCMKIRLIVEPLPGITVVQEIRNCSSLVVCQSNLHCKNANRTGLLKACQAVCCHGNLCHDKVNVTSSVPATPLKCMSQICTRSSLNVHNKCKPALGITCHGYQQCMTSRISVEPFHGISIEKTISNCSSNCNRDSYCKSANHTGLLTSCIVKCCTGNLCNQAGVLSVKQWTSVGGHKLNGRPSMNCSTLVTSELKQCNSRFHSMLINKPLSCRSAFDRLISCFYNIRCADILGMPSQLVPVSSMKQLYCNPLEGTSVTSSTILTLQTVRPSVLHLIPCNLTFYINNLRCTRLLIKIRTINKNDSHLCRFYRKALSCIQQNARLNCRMFTKSLYEDILTVGIYCKTERKCQGSWTKINRSFITGQQSHGVQFQYITRNNSSVLIDVNVTSYSCQRNSWLSLTTFIRGNWTKVKYTQEFRGSTSCWKIFGAPSDNGNYSQNNSSGVEEFNRRHGDQVYNELRMGGVNDAFPGSTSMCGNRTENFWHAQYGYGVRRATVILRRKAHTKHAGIGTSTSCGLPSYTIKDIYVYYC